MFNLVAIFFISIACVTGWNPDKGTYNIDENGCVNCSYYT